MTPSKQAKRVGLKSLAQACEMTKQSPQTLANWHRDKPELFAIVIEGCAARVANLQLSKREYKSTPNGHKALGKLEKALLEDKSNAQK